MSHLLVIAEQVCDGDVVVRDYGLLESALARPRTTVLGSDAYPSVHHKAAALLHSLCTNHALVDGNKRLAIGAAIVFLDINEAFRSPSTDDLFDLTMAVADGSLSDVDTIADHLESVNTDSGSENRPIITAARPADAGMSDAAEPDTA